MVDPVILSKAYTGKILIKYFAPGLTVSQEGLLFVDITSLKEQISLMRDLYIIGGGHIKNLNIIQSYIPDEIQSVLFSPKQKPESLCSNADFVKTCERRNNYWHVAEFNYDEISKTNMLPCELLFMEVNSENICFTGVPYDNKYFSSRFFSYRINLKSIGI